MEYTDFSYTSANDNTDIVLSSTRGFTDVPFDTESSKEIESEKDCPSIRQEGDNVLLDTIVIQDAFIFCPMLEPIVLNKTLVQGIFANERETSELEDTQIFIFNKFIPIEFEKEDANRSKMQAIADYLKDVKDNAKEHNMWQGFSVLKMKL